MTTETREYTAQELQAFGAAGKQLSENGFDVWTDGKEHNMALLNEYFQTNGNVPVTAANIFKAVEARKTEFRWVSPSAVEYYKEAVKSPDQANKLAAWFAATQGQPGTLVNAGDGLFTNLAILILELRGREINQTTIQQAIGRVAYNGRRQLHVVPTQRSLSPAAQADNPNRKPGVFIDGLRKQSDGSLGKSPADYAREAVARSTPSVAPTAASIQSQARERAEGRRGNSHPQTATIQRLFVTRQGSSEIDWVATDDARAQLQNRYNSNRSIH